MSAQFTVIFTPSGRGQAQCPPNPEYPNGVDLDISLGSVQFCTVPLTYPAPECGMFDSQCSLCGRRVAVTAAGRPYDPKSVKIPCRELGKPQ